MSSTAAVPSRRWPGILSTAAWSGVLAAVPALSALNSAVQCTTRMPAARASSQRLTACRGRLTAAAASRSAGNEARSPITPRWSSMVTTATGSGPRPSRPSSLPASSDGRSIGTATTRVSLSRRSVSPRGSRACQMATVGSTRPRRAAEGACSQRCGSDSAPGSPRE